MSAEPPLSSEELQALREALGEAPRRDAAGGDSPLRKELRRDFALLQAALAPVPPMPAHVLARLQAGADAEWEKRYAGDQARPILKNKKTTDAGAGGGFTVIQGGAGKTTDKKTVATVKKPARVSSWLALAAMLVVTALVTSLLMRGDGAEQPTFGWTNAADPAQLYDVWVLPEGGGDAETAPVLFVAKNVRSPVKLTDMKPGPKEPADKPLELQPGKPHRLLVCLATVGKFGGDAVPFTPKKEVLVPPPSAATVLGRLVQAGRMADARKVLEALPDSVRDEAAVVEIAKQIPAQ